MPGKKGKKKMASKAMHQKQHIDPQTLNNGDIASEEARLHISIEELCMIMQWKVKPVCAPGHDVGTSPNLPSKLSCKSDSLIFVFIDAM